MGQLNKIYSTFLTFLSHKGTRYILLFKMIEKSENEMKEMERKKSWKHRDYYEYIRLALFVIVFY